MDREEENKEKLKAIRDLILSNNDQSNHKDHHDVLELTEDDLYDELQEETFPKYQEKFKNKNLVNQNLTMRKYNDSQVMKDESLVDAETAQKSVDKLRLLLSKLEKTAEDLTKPRQVVTVEDAVKDSLKPFLKEWLNKNLHEIVENIVDREVKTIIVKQDKKDE